MCQYENELYQKTAETTHLHNATNTNAIQDTSQTELQLPTNKMQTIKIINISNGTKQCDQCS